MDKVKIKVKDVKEYMKSFRHMYASENGRKRFHILLHAAPNVERYIVEVGGTEQGFTKLGDAVRLFNAV